MYKDANNVIYTEYGGGYQTGDDSENRGNAVDGQLKNLDLEIPEIINEKSVLKIGRSSFYSVALQSLKLPSTLIEIDTYGFDSCSLSLNKLIFPESIKTIAYQAFSNNNIENYVLGSNVESIGAGAFSHDFSLKSISVSEDNKYFTTVNGVLYNKNKSILYCMPYLAKDYKIPFTVTTLMERAICQRAATLWIPTSVSSLSYMSVFHAPNLKTVHFLGDIESINSNSIHSSCSKLQSIVYHGAKTFNKTKAFENFPGVKIYVCREYVDDYFAGKKVERLGSCYSTYRSCKRQRSQFSNMIMISIFMVS